MIDTIAALAVPPAGLPLRLMTWARGAAGWLIGHPMTAVALLAGVFGAVERHDADRWARLARQHAGTIAAIQAANAQATAQAIAAKEAKDAYDAKLAVQSDRRAADLRGRYHAAVVQLAAAQDQARRADLPGAAAAPARRDGPGEGAGVSAGAGSDDADGALAISQADALTCADNTARLQAVHDWAVALGQ